MKTFVDINVKPPIGEYRVQEQMAKMAGQMGLSVVGVRFPSGIASSEIESSREIFRSRGLDVAVGIDLVPNNRKQLLTQLGALRNKFEIVRVICSDTKIAEVASRDSRVDLISLEHQKSFRSRLSALCNCKSALELEISRLIAPSLKARSESLKALCEEIILAERCDVDIVISSGATNAITLRAPRDMASVFTFLGMPKDVSLKAVSNKPLELIKANRDRLSGNSAGSGVRLVRVKRQ
ncbi:MAG: hypothetical protein NTX81_02855 [Candidatus Bathyarchaeota archaeon]|jgi:RNase P/RNase MRP subunit p30|nr:hypothetical protein [Candidatus Bathyarchaeota archaeon]